MTSTSTLLHPLLAASAHDDPYPLYARLRAAHPGGLYRDEELALWVACSFEAVTAVLGHPSLRVRPPGEPVPAALAGTPAGALFGGLMRQNDGPVQTRGKAWATALLGSAGPVDDAVQAVVSAGATPTHATLNDLLFEAPVRVLWALLAGDEAGDLPQLVRRVIAGWSPSADESTRQAANEAASVLLARCDGEPNRVGLYTQTCEATAGLMGAVLVALQREPRLRTQWLANPGLDDALASEVARHDPPVQNTRRWAAEACTVQGKSLQAGDGVLVLLASANRDERTTPQADRFDLSRHDARNLTWGHGVHACPGAALSRRIAMGLLRHWHAHDAQALERLTRRWGYRPSPNGRLAQFHAAEEH